MTREEAFQLVNEKINNRNLVKHTLSVESVMRKLSKKFNEDTEKWGLSGLLHDIDYEETKNEPSLHSLKGAEELEKLGVNPDIVYAIKVHNEMHNLPRNSKLDKALYCADPLTGLIVAAVLVLPDKKLSSLTPDSVLKRFKEKSFAKGANREVIKSCEELGLTLEEFVKIGLEAMQEISNDLGL